MKLLKNAGIAILLALSMGSFSSTAVACEDGRTCVGNEQAIDMILTKITEAKQAIGDGADAKAINLLIKQAKAASKEINSEAVDRKKQKVTKYFLKAKQAMKKGNMDEATEHLNTAEKGFADIKGSL